MFDAAPTLGLTRLRDSLRWPDVEREKGRYRFDSASTRYPDLMLQRAMHLTLTINTTNPLYDGGKTPHSPDALAALGRFAAALVERYPAIDTLEIGNEINGANFVTGPVREGGLDARRQVHLATVRAVSAAVARVRAEVTVLGGATHSLPGGFLWPLLENDPQHAITGLALHPYTTPIDQLPAQLGVLCRSPAVSGRGVFVTEFGSATPRTAPDDLVRGFVTLAALGAREMDWYPLSPRGDGLVALVDRRGARTPTGRAFSFVQSHLAGKPALAQSPDRFTFITRFATHAWVLWGAPRPLTLTGTGSQAFDASGEPLGHANLRLAPDRALIVLADGNADPAHTPFTLGCSPLVADSFYQFAYPAAPRTGPDENARHTPPQPPGTFERFAWVKGQRQDFVTLPGQQRSGVPWTPYLGLPGYRAARIDAQVLRPDFGREDGAFVLRLRPPHKGVFRLEATLAPVSSAHATGSLPLTLSLETPRTPPVSEPLDRATTLTRTILFEAGEALTVRFAANRAGQSVGPDSPRPRTGAVRYRVQLFDDAACPHGA
ncbi:hypothetical protein MTR62_14575 [Novosphingobium sp. 1949]|uniref:Asl1-like glycosyl hydrolase catalytic domain-containing protein n=1 Tax=Novosphingobium organovorum TaxID=2930092 RepID=A0ABT0BFR9_9SPHN|nr:hypothetical protein [Novosphingobium organovorum]